VVVGIDDSRLLCHQQPKLDLKKYSLSFTEERSMRRLMQIMVLAGCLTTTVGCFVPIYSARPERRVQQLLFTSDDLRAMVDEWERFWFMDSPSHLTPIRTHGGIL